MTRSMVGIIGSPLRTAGAVSGSLMSPGFDHYFEFAAVDIFRLETLQSYGNSGEDPALVVPLMEGLEHDLLPRPGHADLAGVQKFGHSDVRDALERADASARVSTTTS